MTILDTFIMIFESDASKLDKGLDESKKKGKDVERTMFDADHAAGLLGESLKGVLIGALAAAGAFLSLHALADAIKEQAEFADRLGKSAEMLNVNVSELHAYGEAAARSGGSVDAFVQSLRTVTENLALVAATGHSRAKPFFDQLGISMLDASGKARNVMDILPEIASAIEGMDKNQSTGILGKLGFDTGTILLLQSGRRAVEDLVARQKSLGVVTKEQSEVAEKFNDQLDDTKQIFGTVARVIGTLVLPGLTWVLEKFEALFRSVQEHKDTFKVLGEIFIAAGIGILTYYLPAITAAAAATIVATWPFLLAAAAVAALFLAIDDLVTFLHGGDSVIGDFAKRFPLLGDVIRAVAAAMSGDLGPALKMLGSLSDAIVKRMLGAWESFVNFILSIPSKIGDVIGRFGKFIASVGMAGVIGMSPAASLPRGFDEDLQAGKSALGETNTPLGARSSTSILAGGNRGGDRTNSVKIDKIEVNTQATDADGVAGAVGSAMDQQLRQTLDQHDDGVKG